MRPEPLAEKSARPATARVFFGLWPSPELAGQLAGIADAAAGRFGGRPTRPDTIHLTLAFLGDFPEPQLPALCEAASRIAFQSFDLRIDHLGFWPRQRLLWAGCHDTPAVLPVLAGDLLRAPGAAGFSVPGRERPFVPHVTLVRKLPANPQAEISHRLPALAPLSWRCTEFVLVRSQLGVGGSRYQEIASFPAKYRLD